MKNKEFRQFYLGVAALALTIGGVVGASATSVVGTLIPLLFALLTAGGAFYVIRGDISKTPEANQSEAKRRAEFLGGQLLAFAVGFGVGLWLGVASKLHADKVWFVRQQPKAAYSDLKFDDMRLLVVSIELDKRMRNSGLEFEVRKAVFKQVGAALDARRQLVGNGIVDLTAAFKPWSEPVVSNTVQVAEQLSTLVDRLNKFSILNSDEREKELSAIKTSLDTIRKQAGVMIPSYPTQQLADLQKRHNAWSTAPLLSGQDLEIIVGLLDGKLKPDEQYTDQVSPQLVEILAHQASSHFLK